MHDLRHFLFIGLQDVLDTTWDFLILHDDVLDANSETVENKPVIDNFLDSTQEISTGLRTKVFNDNVSKTLACWTNDALVDRAA